MPFDVNQFLNSRDEWHYWWAGFAAGHVVGLTFGAVALPLLFSHNRLVPQLD